MKQSLLLILLFSAVMANGQSLKDALYGGKLKNDPGTVIRKTDDLSTKIDTTRKALDSVKLKAPVVAEAAAKKPAVATDVAASANNTVATQPAATDSAAAIPLPAAIEAAPVETAAVAPAPKDNNALWKEYMNGLQPALKSEVLPNKKVKKGTYSVMVSYTIDTDGQTAVGEVFVAPENDYLKDQVKSRLVDAPKLAPVLNSTGAARKVTKRYSFTLTKD